MIFNKNPSTPKFKKLQSVATMQSLEFSSLYIFCSISLHKEYSN